MVLSRVMWWRRSIGVLLIRREICRMSTRGR
jgi:hypothetical protein